MRILGIRNRILLAALAPALLVALLVTSVLIVEHARQAHIEQHRRLSAVARQIATAAEYNLFVGNHDALRHLLDSAIEESDVIGAMFLDSYGRVIASTVSIGEHPRPGEVIPDFSPTALSESTIHWHRQPIEASSLRDLDLFFDAPAAGTPTQLGELLLKVSNKSLNREMTHFALKSVGVTLVIMVFGLLLAITLASGLIRALGEISRVVEAIRRGRNDARIRKIGRDELGQLAQGINEMAVTVGQTQDMLAARVEAATAALRHERDEAEKAAEARSRFFAAASHDLRQPVQALGLFIARLERDAANGPLLPRVQQLDKSVKNLQDLLDTLLDYSRISGQVYRIEMKPVRSTEIFSHLIEEFSAAAAEKRLVLRHRIAPCWLATDRALLHRILLNLLGNAVRYTERGTILLACRRGATHARIEIWDTGPGIPEEAQTSVFDELVQLSNPERDATKGLGLGLAIVRRTADLLGHPLSLCSRVGHGSRFSLFVPLAAPVGETPPALAPERGRDPLEDLRIMVIAADLDTQERLADLLGGWDCQPILVDGPGEAGAWLAAHIPPDCVIWEVAGGAAEARSARNSLDQLETATRLALPAIIVSDGPGPSLESSGMGSPRLLLARPFRPARLRALLGRVLELDD